MYYDSSFHKRCPACLNEILKTALNNWELIADKNSAYEGTLLEFIRLSLEAIESTPETKQEIVSKREYAYAKTTELQQSIKKAHEELLEYSNKNEMKPIFSE